VGPTWQGSPSPRVREIATGKPDPPTSERWKHTEWGRAAERLSIRPHCPVRATEHALGLLCYIRDPTSGLRSSIRPKRQFVLLFIFLYLISHFQLMLKFKFQT
jgi:hypothetical protein